MWRQNVLNQAEIVETIPKISRLSTTQIERYIFALQLHFDDRISIYTYIASLNYTSNYL
jgi:hypothetical protein